MALIKDRKRAADRWQLLEPDAHGANPDVPAQGDFIVSLAHWRALREQSAERRGATGVWLAADEDPAELAPDLERLALVAVQFKSFTDGRGYSIARLLRQRYGFRGELRAIGDIQRDQLHYLARCGFDACQLRDGEDAEAALGAFADFTEAYQASVDRPLPLFRRREPGAHA